MRLLLSILFLCSIVSANAATIVADSCSRAHVSNAWFLCSSGDTLQIPAGTCDWAEQQFFTNKAVRITGAGIGSTIIRDACTDAIWITIWLQAGLTTEIDNIEFTRNGGWAFSDRIHIYGINNDNRNIKWHDCKFSGWASGTLFSLDTVRGDFYYNQFIDLGLLFHAKDSYYAGAFGTRDFGNASLAAGDTFGTTNFVYFEDNLYSNAVTGGLDAQAGGRYAYRRNTNYNVSPQTHGSEASERSGRAFEIYANYFDGGNSGSLANTLYMRGGVTLCFSNVFTNYVGGSAFNLVDNRIREHLFAPFGGASGINPWDTNSSSLDSGTVSDTGTPGNTVTDFSKSWSVNQYQHHQLIRTSGKTVTSLSRSGGTATAQVTGHGFSTGDYVSFWGANEYAWNIIHGTITVTGPNEFTFAVEAYPTPATGTIKCSSGNNFARILSNTATNLIIGESIYAGGHNFRVSAGDTYEIRKVYAAMDQVGVYGGTNFGVTFLPDVYNTFAGAQTVSACYQWDNTFPGGSAITWTTTFAGGGDFDHIISGKHYSNNAAKPGYTPYQYPHELRSGVEPTSGSRGRSHKFKNIRLK